MALSRAKYRRIPDLYVTGTELVLEDGTVLWLRILNPFERDEATHDAQLARARLILALKSEHGSDERITVEAAFLQQGEEKARESLASITANDKLIDILLEIRDSPEWAERLELSERRAELLSRPESDPERLMLDEINVAYVAEIERRQEEERAYETGRLAKVGREALLNEYIDFYIKRRGDELAGAEFALTEAWYAARACEGVLLDDGSWNHNACEGHDLQVFEHKGDFRRQPEPLQDLITESLKALNMSGRDARFSARQQSSSESSPLPSKAEESTPSSPDATLVGAHGT